MESEQNLKSKKLILETDSLTVSILNSVLSEIVVIDDKGQIVAVNEAWQRFSRENSDGSTSHLQIGAVGSNYFIAEAGLDSLESDLKDVGVAIRGIRSVLSGEASSFEYEYPCHSPSEKRWFNMVVTPLAPHGRGAVISHTNVTERKMAELALIESQMHLVRSARLVSLGEMSAGIAHEINNPLAIIAGTAGLLERIHNDPQKLSSRVQTIQKSCDRIARIVNGLKKFSRSGDKSQLDLRPLKKIIEESLMLTEANLKRNGTALECHLSADPTIECNEVEIEQVFVNLINNAVDAIEDGGSKWIKIHLWEDHHQAVVRVIDSGLGIPENIRVKMFEPFFTTKPVGKGTGLGLSITKGILDEHRATIQVLTDTPHTCFELRFPIWNEDTLAT